MLFSIFSFSLKNHCYGSRNWLFYYISHFLDTYSNSACINLSSFKSSVMSLIQQQKLLKKLKSKLIQNPIGDANVMLIEGVFL